MHDWEWSWIRKHGVRMMVERKIYPLSTSYLIYYQIRYNLCLCIVRNPITRQHFPTFPIPKTQNPKIKQRSKKEVLTQLNSHPDRDNTHSVISPSHQCAPQPHHQSSHLDQPSAPRSKQVVLEPRIQGLRSGNRDLRFLHGRFGLWARIPVWINLSLFQRHFYLSSQRNVFFEFEIRVYG